MAGLANVFTKRSGGSIIDVPITEGGGPSPGVLFRDEPVTEGPSTDEPVIGSKLPETEEVNLLTRINQNESNDHDANSSSSRKKGSNNEKYSRIDIESLRNKHLNSKHANLSTSLEDSMNSLDFKSPIHPCGSVLTLEILSTWGDSIYVGLNGIDIFDEKGNLLSFTGAKSNITSVIGNPSSISVLPEIGTLHVCLNLSTCIGLYFCVYVVHYHLFSHMSV